MSTETSLEPTRSSVPATTERRRLTSQERAAIILALMEPEAAQKIAAEFDDGLVENAIASFRRLRIVPPEDLVTTVRAFNNALQSDLPLLAGGARRANALASTLTPALPKPSDEAQGTPELGLDALGADATAEEVWSYLNKLSAAETVRLLRNERPALIAAVARRIPRANAAAVLDAIPEEQAGQALRLLIAGKAPSDRTYDAVAHALRKQAPGRLAASDAKEGTEVATTAAILNAIPARRQDSLLTRLSTEDPEAAEQLEPLVLRFANLQDRLPKTIVPTLFREVSESLLDQALSLALRKQPDTAEFLLSCISQRLAEMIRERIEEKPPVSAADGDAAQTEIMQILISWSEEDRFSFKPPPEES